MVNLKNIKHGKHYSSMNKSILIDRALIKITETLIPSLHTKYITILMEGTHTT